MKDINDLQKDSKALTKGSQYMSVRTALEKQEAQLKNALPPRISVKRFLRIVYTAMHMNPKLQECSKDSLIASVFKCAERGLMPNGRHGALVPYYNGKKRVMEAQFQEMFQGLIHLARQAGDIADIIPATIRENDEWTYELGLHMDLRHKPALVDRGKPVAYYAVIVFPDGQRSFGPGPMSVEEIEIIRQRSKSKDNGPWVTDPEAMAWKTVIKRNLKYIGASPELEDALIEDDNIEYGSMDVSIPVYDEVETPAPTQIPQKPPEWPKWDGTKWVDKAGDAYDPEKHASPMSVTTNDLFRKRRQPKPREDVATEPPREVPPEIVTGGEPGADVPF